MVQTRHRIIRQSITAWQRREGAEQVEKRSKVGRGEKLPGQQESVEVRLSGVSLPGEQHASYRSYRNTETFLL